MREWIFWFLGYHKVAICGAMPQNCLNRLTALKIPFWDVQMIDEFTLHVKIVSRDLSAVAQCAERAMCQCSVLARFGFPQQCFGLKKRKFLLIVFALCLLTVLILPRFIWFFKVEGNTAVPSEKILRAVQECGVRIGTYGKSIMPEKIKDRVLVKLPELAWLTVTQKGGCATISVREREGAAEVEDRRAPMNIVASADGVIEEITVLDGAAAVKKGQTVKAGELLISAYVDLEYKIRMTGANGEVYARTWLDFNAVTPSEYQEKVYTQRQKEIYYLELGNYRIKLSAGSGIFTIGCDKMTRRSELTLPGGFSLPIAIVKESYTYYEAAPSLLTPEAAEDVLLTSVRERKGKAMVAGEILHTDASYDALVGFYRSEGILECREMIGRFTNANIFKDE